MNAHRKFVCFVQALLLVVLLNVGASAQQDLARIEGVVRDDSGAAVAGATVVIKSAALGIERTTSTSEKGLYSFPQLRPGVYTVLVSAQGFTPAQANDIELGVGQNRSLDIALKVGQVQEQVVMVAAGEEAATVDTSSSRLGVNVTAREVKELPVNGRNYSQLQLLSPGATNAGVGNFNEIRFNGRSNQQNQTKLDGIESTAIWDASPGYLTVQGSQFRLQTSLENIQEFRVDSSVYPAEYGTGTGGQITVIGKSGGNDFHGSLFHYLRNDALDARNAFDGAQKSPLRLNQFGGSFGGRLIKDRLFFFGSFEGLRQRAGFNIIELTPSNFARDFINFVGTSDPRGATAAAALGLNPSAADLTRIQALRASGAINAFPIGAGPTVSVAGLPNAAQFLQLNLNSKLDENAYSFRFDGKINEKLNGYVRFQRNTGDLVSPDGTTGRFLAAQQDTYNAVASLTQLYGGAIINETKFGANRPFGGLKTTFPTVAGSNLDFSLSAFNLTGSIVQPGVNGGAPTGFASPGGLTRQSSAGNGRSQPVNPLSFSFIDNLSIIKGNHTLKFGGEFRAYFISFDQLGGVQYNYASIRDFLLNQNLTTAFVGDLSAPGNFQIATNPVTTIERPTGGDSRARQQYYIFYGQDEWRLRSNVTLNYGLRYEYYTPVREADNRAVVFDVKTGQLLDPNATDFYRSAKTNFAPRLGITWSPEWFKGKTVIRAGGGLFYGPGQFEDLIQPIESNVFRATANVPGGLTATTFNDVTSTRTPVSNFTPRAYDRAYRVPERVGQYSVSIQQELPGNTVLTLAYVGSQGRNLFLRGITNTLLPGTATISSTATSLPTGVGVVNITNAQGQVVAVRQVRQFSIVNGTNVINPFGEIDYKTSGGRDSFNALQVAVNRRFTKGLTLGANYQWGHSIGNTQGSNEAQTTQDPFNFNGERGNNTFDIRHSVNISALYELPFGKGKAFQLNGVADVLLGGWQVGGVYNGRSGVPLDIRVTRTDLVLQNPTTGEVRAFVNPSATSPLPAGFIAVVNTPGGNATRNTRRPDIVPGVNPYITSGGLRFLNPAAFAIPQPGTYGNLARGALFGPNFHQFDLTLQKRFALSDKVRLEFRSEIYNLLNRANFANPPATLPNNLSSAAGGQQPGQGFTTANAGNFGIINGTVGRIVGLGTNRQLQFSLRVSF